MSLDDGFEQEARKRRERYDLRQEAARNFELEQQERQQREQAVAARLQPLLARAVREAAREIAPLLPAESANTVFMQPVTEKVAHRNYGFDRLVSGKYSMVDAVRHTQSPGWIISESRTRVENSLYDNRREATLWRVQESGIVLNEEGLVLAYEERRENWGHHAGSYELPVNLSSYRNATDAEIAAKPCTQAEWHNALLNLIPTTGSTGTK